jgi:hypothetical protein
MTTKLPTPPRDLPWAHMITQALQTFIVHNTERFGVLEMRTTDAGRMQLSPITKPKVGELTANGQLVSKAGQPALFRAIGTTFNTGGEAADKFRVPNVAGPAGLEWRISTGS